MSNPIIAQPNPEHKPMLAHYRITPMLFHQGNLMHCADGVVTVDGVAWLGQVTGTGPEFRVNAFINAAGYGWQAPAGWQADVTASSTLNGGGSQEPPPPVALFPVAARYTMQGRAA